MNIQNKLELHVLLNFFENILVVFDVLQREMTKLAFPLHPSKGQAEPPYSSTIKIHLISYIKKK